MTEEKKPGISGENPFKLVDNLMTKKLDRVQEIINDYNTLYDYVKPFIQCNEDMAKLGVKIKTQLVLIPVDDMVVNLSMLTMNQMTMDMMDKARKDMKEMVKNMSLPEELFNDEPPKKT